MSLPYNLNKWFRDLQLGKNAQVASLSTNSAGKVVINERVSGNQIILDDALVFNVRTRIAIADLAAATTLLPAIPGYRYRMIRCTASAFGGNAATSTSIDVSGTRAAAAVILVSFVTTDLDTSEVHWDGDGTTGVVLADGASYTQLDVNTAITAAEVGAGTTGATHIDLNLSYCVEA